MRLGLRQTMFSMHSEQRQSVPGSGHRHRIVLHVAQPSSNRQATKQQFRCPEANRDDRRGMSGGVYGMLGWVGARADRRFEIELCTLVDRSQNSPRKGSCESCGNGVRMEQAFARRPARMLWRNLLIPTEDDGSGYLFVHSELFGSACCLGAPGLDIQCSRTPTNILSITMLSHSGAFCC